MSKIHYQYIVNVSGTIPSVFFLDIDWTVPTTYTVVLGNPQAYQEVTKALTTFTKQNFFLGDYYMVIRNDSSSTGNGTKVE